MTIDYATGLRRLPARSAILEVETVTTTLERWRLNGAAFTDAIRMAVDSTDASGGSGIAS